LKIGQVSDFANAASAHLYPYYYRSSSNSMSCTSTALRRAARERGGPLPSIDVADALLDERRAGGPG
jgi:hypothetical protein